MDGSILSDFLNWYLFSPVGGAFLTILRMVVFGFPFYLLLSRYYGHVRAVPDWYFSSQYRGKRLSTLTLLSPKRVPITFIYMVAVLSCATGILGISPAFSAVAASMSIIILNNYYSSVTTSDLEVLPYVVGMWTFAVLPGATTVPLWAELGGLSAPQAPSFPFRVLQMYLCSALLVNGVTKVPFWREWVTEKGVFYDARNWNRLSPYLDTYWSNAEHTRDLPYVWEAMGVLTIVIEIGAATALIYPPSALFWWIGLVGLMVGNHLLRSTSFLLFPWIYLAMFLPWLLGVFS